MTRHLPPFHRTRWVRAHPAVVLVAMLTLPVAAGCIRPTAGGSGGPPGTTIETLAMRTLTGALIESVPVVQVRAIEAMQQVAPQSGGPYFNELLLSTVPPVRFAALMAVGTVRHAAARERVAALLNDPNPSVQVGAIFALHRLGDTRQTTKLSVFLLNHTDAGVRANAAMALGRLGEKGAIPTLEQGLRDREESVRLQVMESLVLLGDKKSTGRLGFVALSSTGQKMVFALLALRNSNQREVIDVFIEQFTRGIYDEVKLAAAAGLGRFGRRDGLSFALDRFQRFTPHPGGADTPEQQVIRVKTLAALAIEECGDPSALDVLDRMLRSDDDISIRVAAARTAISLLHRGPSRR